MELDKKHDEHTKLWNAQRVLEILNRDEKLKEEVARNLCVDIVAFVSDPNQQLQKDISKTIRLLHGMNAKVVYLTTKNSFEKDLTYHPSTIMFIGHAKNNYLHFTNDNKIVDPYSFDSFLKTIKEKYKPPEKPPKYIILSACCTIGILQVLDDDEVLKTFFNNTTFIGWKTVVENRIVSEFDCLVIEHVKKNTLNSETFKSLCTNFLESENSHRKKFGDPLKQLIQYEEHINKFSEFFRERVEKKIKERNDDQMFGTLTYWRNDLIFDRRSKSIDLYIESCPHCNPMVFGIPFFCLGDYTYLPTVLKVEEKDLKKTPTKKEQGKHESPETSKTARQLFPL